MKYLYLFSFVFLLALSSCQGQETKKAQSAIKPDDKIELIDFYGTHRCFTCNAIEQNARYTVDTYFAEAIKSGKLEFKTVNVDLEENKDIAERFEAFGTALFINLIKEGKEEHIDLTNFAFENARDKDAFSSKLKVRIDEQLNRL